MGAKTLWLLVGSGGVVAVRLYEADRTELCLFPCTVAAWLSPEVVLLGYRQIAGCHASSSSPQLWVLGDEELSSN